MVHWTVLCDDIDYRMLSLHAVQSTTYAARTSSADFTVTDADISGRRAV